jgi:ATP-dependent RNA helicase RhlB
MKFSESNFSQKVLSGIEEAGFSDCTPVQERVFETALQEKRDVMVQSQTGSGKTAAFLLTIFELFEREKDIHHKALIIAPTRELAVQIEQEAELLGAHMDSRIACLYGGAGYNQQERKLADDPNIIIGTPGRLLDFANSGKVSLGDVDMLVIDEADRMFDMGFLPDLKKILRKTSKIRTRQTMLFTATLSTRVTRLAWEFMHEAEEIVINPDDLTVQEINQVLYHVPSEEKMSLLLGILRREKPRSVLIFTNTKDMAVRVSARLGANGFQAEYIMGDLPQRKRLKIIQNIKAGRLDILVATDVAARGLHINDLEMVINYDIPEDPENYVHRIGRTARAGKSGKAITLACEKFVYGLEPIEDLIEMKIPFEHPDEELLNQEDKSAHMKHLSLRRSRDADRGKSGRSRLGSQRRSSTGLKRSQQAPGRAPRSDRSDGPGSHQDDRRARRDNTGVRDTREDRAGSRPAKKKPSQKQANKSAKKPAQRRDTNPDKKPAGKPETKPREKPGRDTNLDSRLEYYRRKYGEDFKIKE